VYAQIEGKLSFPNATLSPILLTDSHRDILSSYKYVVRKGALSDVSLDTSAIVHEICRFSYITGFGSSLRAACSTNNSTDRRVKTRTYQAFTGTLVRQIASLTQVELTPCLLR